ncbi:DNA-processing protein DprA [uncultured Veillonella sp.]|uniref:DNA-processing protein DprA n=1 Tax=uncultured Veillonella sp. TaxID=159268 RepID=UPI0026372E79|nr:DNA-processing protein DprA [uncultured Veillonella sp.]
MANQKVMTNGLNEQDIQQEELIYWAALGSMPGVGAVTCRQLITHFGSPKSAWHALQSEALNWTDVPITKRSRTALKNSIGHISLKKIEDQLMRWHIGVIPFTSSLYPKQLNEIFNPPAVLFYRGNARLLERKYMVAMVGARDCSHYGRNVANVLGAQLGRAGVVVVSGGARGIDSYAHEGALSGGGETIAVMGCGLEQAYPKSNGPLFRRIEESGGVLLSEYGPGIMPMGYHFPMRNRIITGLVKAVIVVEAKKRSGALITADYAINEGRDVLAVPGDILSDNFAGNHWLISEGAALITKVDDVFSHCGWSYEKQASTRALKKDSSHNGSGMISFTMEEHKILEALNHSDETSLESLALSTNLPEGALHLSLLNLEMKRCIARTPTKGYIILELGRNQFVH